MRKILVTLLTIWSVLLPLPVRAKEKAAERTPHKVWTEIGTEEKRVADRAEDWVTDDDTQKLFSNFAEIGYKFRFGKKLRSYYWIKNAITERDYDNDNYDLYTDRTEFRTQVRDKVGYWNFNLSNLYKNYELDDGKNYNLIRSSVSHTWEAFKKQNITLGFRDTHKYYEHDTRKRGKKKAKNEDFDSQEIFLGYSKRFSIPVKKLKGKTIEMILKQELAYETGAGSEDIRAKSSVRFEYSW